MSDLAQALLHWFRGSKRLLPWREKRTPYSTWVSEIMLQQTTVEVVKRKFPEFLRKFPDVAALADADEDSVLSAWSGLGYYRRARALRSGALEVVHRHAGLIPGSEAELRALPGVGAYTAAAIASLAFDQRAAAIDGNVARVLARLVAETGDTGRASLRRRFEDQILEWMPEGESAAFTEALIEIGALVCRPTSPLCEECPIRSFCAAKKAGIEGSIPARANRRVSIPVSSFRAVLGSAGDINLVRRSSDLDLLPGFFEFPGRWGVAGEEPSEVLGPVLHAMGARSIRVGDQIARARHTITHHRITSMAFEVLSEGPPPAHELETLARVPRSMLTTETRKLLRVLEAPV